MTFIQRIKAHTINLVLTKKKTFLTLTVIMLLAGFLRWYHIGAQSLWGDELFSVSYSKMDLSNLVLILKGDLNPPFYFFLLHYWVVLFGFSETALRSMSFVFGIFTIPMIYTVAKELFTPLTGLLSALLLSLSRFHIYFSQETRSYSLMGLLTLVSFYFLLKLIKGESTKLDVAGLIISNSFLLYTHSASVFIILAQNVIWLILKIYKKTPISYFTWSLYQTLVIMVFSPWLAVEIHQFQYLQGMNIYGNPTLFGLVNTFYQYSGSFFLLFFFSLIFLFGLYSRLRRNSPAKPIPNSTRTPFLLIWICLPILAPFILSQFISPIYTARNTLSAAFGFYILIGKNLTAIKNIIVTILMVFVIMMASAQNLITYYSVPDKEQWREAVDYVDSHAQTGDMISINAPAYDYYNKRADLVRVEDLSITPDQKKRIITPQLWVIKSTGEGPGILQTIKGTFTYNQKKDFFRVSVSLYTNNQLNTP